MKLKPIRLQIHVVSLVCWIAALGAAHSAYAQCTPAPAGMIGWWTGDADVTDMVFTNNGTMQGGVGSTAGLVGNAFTFDGAVGSAVSIPYGSNMGPTNIRDDFSIEFWANPALARLSTPESTSGYAGISGQRYAIFPAWGTPGSAGVGVSVGTNGISVIEHSVEYAPSLLVWDAPVLGWTHVAVVYENKQPTLYVNGSPVRTGLVSPRSFVFPSTVIGDPAPGYGPYAGLLDEVSIYNRALSAGEVAAIFTADSAGKCPLPPFEITVQPTNQTSYSCRTISFTASASGAKPLSYQWYFETAPVPDATTSTLTLSDVRTTNSGL